MKNKRIKQVAWITVALVLAYTAFFVITDARKNMEALRGFPWRWLPLILGAVLINFTLRWIKWEWFRRAAGIKVPLAGSFLVYFSGYSMSISPGRGGELIKPFMYKEYFNQRMRRTIPLVFCERVSDLLGMLVLTVITGMAFVSGVAAAKVRAGAAHAADGAQMGGRPVTVTLIGGFLAMSVVVMALMLYASRQKRFVYGALAVIGKGGRRRGKLARVLRHIYFATYPLLNAKNLIITTALAAVSWSFECYALDKVLEGAGAPQVTFAQATFLFCMATIFGGFVMTPGGLGGFEGAMLAMLAMLGVLGAPAYTGMTIIRFSTLFFSVVLGFLFIFLTSALYHKRMLWDEFEHAEEDIEHETADGQP